MQVSLGETLGEKPHWSYLASLERTQLRKNCRTVQANLRAPSSRYRPTSPFESTYFPKQVLRTTCWEHLPSTVMLKPRADVNFAGFARAHADSFISGRQLQTGFSPQDSRASSTQLPIPFWGCALVLSHKKQEWHNQTLRETLDAQDATEAGTTRRTNTRAQRQKQTCQVKGKAAMKTGRGHLASVSAGSGWKAQLLCKIHQTWTSSFTCVISPTHSLIFTLDVSDQ